MSELTNITSVFRSHCTCTGSWCAADHPKSVVYTGYCTVSASIFHNPQGAHLKNNPLGTVQYPIHNADNTKSHCRVLSIVVLTNLNVSNG